MPSYVNVAMVGPRKGLVGNRGFFAVAMVVLLLALTTMALIGPYQLALADWHATH
jgi:hypothetical protein